MKNGKSPGPNGLTFKFYKILKKEITIITIFDE